MVNRDPEQDQQDADTFRLQNLFDTRYVLRDGAWRLIVILVFGLVGLILIGFFTVLVGVFTDKLFHPTVTPSPTAAEINP